MPTQLRDSARYGDVTVHRSGRVRLLLVALTLLCCLVAAVVVAWREVVKAGSTTATSLTPADLTSGVGQAAVALGGSDATVTVGQRPVPVASVAKVMTAYLVLTLRPLSPGENGPMLTVTAADVADTAQRRSRAESVVAVEDGEELTELQALQALLIPSANNMAAILADWAAGSEPAFVTRMNQVAHKLRMTHTSYTDPSGFDPDTVSTAADQLRLAEAAMREPVLAVIVGTPAVRLPVAGTVHNTDTLLGRHGFVGIKTGSDDAAGGCFMFEVRRTVNGRDLIVRGVVLGQPSLAGALAVAAHLADVAFAASG